MMFPFIQACRLCRPLVAARLRAPDFGMLFIQAILPVAVLAGLGLVWVFAGRGGEDVEKQG